MNARLLRHCGNTPGRFQNSSGEHDDRHEEVGGAVARVPELDERAGHGRNHSWIDSSWKRPMKRSTRMTRSALWNACSGMPSAAIWFEPNWFRVHE